jgi:plasmid stabilization system protein ParE
MFLVVWSETAFDKMANLIRFNPERRDEFAAALREISEQLSHNARHAGESREEEMRVMFAGELSVFFRVDGEHQTVEVGNVRLRRP